MLLSNNYGISWSTFPRPGASEAEQVAAQLDICEAVTSEVDTIANGILRATVDLEDETGPDYIITVLQNGWVRFRFPNQIQQIISAQYCFASEAPPPTWNPIPLSALTTEHTITPPTGTTVPTGATSPTSILIAPGYINWFAGRKGFRVQVTAITGYPHAGIDREADVGSSSLHVDDITGWWNGTAGARGLIYDPPLRESVTVAGVTPDDAGAISGPGTLTLTAPTQYPHRPVIGRSNVADQKVLVTTMPRALIQAGFYMATHFGLIRGATASVMQRGTPQVVSSQAGAQDWYDRAEKLIMRYGRTL